MDDKFEILYKQFKSEGYEDCTDKDMNNLLEWSSKINQAPKIRYKELIESMSNPDNSSDGIDLEVDTTINDDFNE